MAISKKHWRLIEAGEEIRTSSPEFQDRAYMTPLLVQATLPHRQPRSNPPEWFRRNGHYTLSIRPGYATNRKTGERYCIGYPSGTIPRLLMFWIITEVKRGSGSKLWLGETLSDFMRQLGLNPRNGSGQRSDAARLEREMRRLFAATISFEYATPEVESYRDLVIAPQREFWWNAREPTKLHLWKSWIHLSDQFHAAIESNPFPVDLRVLSQLKSSPLALDLYSWATYKTFVVNRGKKPHRIPWKSLQMQIGTGYSRTSDFRKYAEQALNEINVLYRGLRFHCTAQAIVIHPGETSVTN